MRLNAVYQRICNRVLLARAALTRRYTFIHHTCFLWAWRLGMDMRSATISFIFRKIMRIDWCVWPFASFF